MNEIDDLYQYHKLLYGYVFSLCRKKELAEDIVQETFVKAILHAKSFRGECKIEVWLCQMAKNLYYSHLRKKENRNVPLLDEILRALHDLPEPYKEVFSLHVLGEVKLTEIAELFGKSASWAGVTYYRAKQKIRERLKEDGYGQNTL